MDLAAAAMISCEARIAMALIAWYAMIPPATGLRAPLSSWEQLRAFDSAEECEKMAIAYAKQAAAQTDNAARNRFSRVEYVRCVHVSDSRLRP